MSLRRFLALLVLFASTWAALAAAERVFDAAGVVRAPLGSDGRIVIAHGDIPGFMPAMTMSFAVADAGEAAALQAGDEVSFRLHVGRTSATAADFVVTGHQAASATGRTTAAAAVRRLHDGDAVPDFSLITEAGAALTAQAFRGHATLVTFIFTRCPVPDYCPAVALRFGELQRAILADAALARRARLLSITLDPAYDRPVVLQAYGAAVGANPAVWHFATGTPEAVSSLTRAFSVFTERNGVTLDHTLCTALVGRDGCIVQIWRGNGWHTAEVLAALRATGG